MDEQMRSGPTLACMQMKAPARGVPADVMRVRTRPSVHGNRILKAFPNSKQDTEGRYELSSVRSSCTYP